MSIDLESVKRCDVIAVRRGREVRNCLFFSWSDANPQVQGYEFAEYHVFHSMEDGRDYLTLRSETCSEHSNTDNISLQSKEVCYHASTETETHTIAAMTQSESVNSDNMNIEQTCDDVRQNECDNTKLPSSGWIRMLEDWKAYRDQTGSFEIIGNDQKSESLRKWVYEQTYQYKLFRQGKKSAMNEIKIDMMKNFGYKLDYESWEIRFEQLKDFYTSYGHLHLANNPRVQGLAKWLKQQQTCLVNISKGRQTFLTRDQVDRLASLGINCASAKLTLSQSSITKAPRTETTTALQNWNNMFKQLEQHKSQTGHLNVSFHENKSLASWIVTQRTEYKKLKNGQSNRMTAIKMQRLTELGFQFMKRPSYKSWDERMIQLRNFKNEHGHLRIQVSDNDLGEFVSRMRQEYNKFQEGKKSSLSNERIIALTNLGFDWGNRGPATAKSARSKKMTWDERFEELLAYRNIHGDCLVPQHTSLGEWGHKQRTEYKKLKNGKPTRMTATKIQKLTEIGFIFDVLGHRKRINTQRVNIQDFSIPNQLSRSSNFDVPFISEEVLDPHQSHM